MKALTVRQPWAWAIVHGGKDVETRTQAWAYRGPLAIHAGAQTSDDGLQSPLVHAAAARANPDLPPVVPSLVRYWRQEAAVPLSAIIGVVELVDVHVAARTATGTCCSSAWAQYSVGPTNPVVHLLLERPQPLAEPIPATGRLGLWTPDAERLDRIREQVPA